MTGGGRLRLSTARLELLESRLRAEGIDRSKARTITPRPDPAAPVPLTFSQSRFWFLSQFSSNTSAYVISAALRVRGDFDPEVFARACAEVVRRHEALRTVFVELDGQPMQQVRPDLPPEVTIVDWRSVAPADVLSRVAEREAELVARPFDLGTGPLMRVEVCRLGPDDAAVLLNLHHIVCDRWSMGVLMRELTRAYGALATGRQVDLAPLPVQYADFARWEHESSSAAAWQADLDYWVGRLAGVPVDIGLPTDRPRPREKTYRGSSVPVEVPPALVPGLRELARAAGCSLFMLLTAVYQVLLWRLSGTDDIVVGTPVAGRTEVELEPLIGNFINTLALRTDMSGNPTGRELLRRVVTVCFEAYEHQRIPFERLVEHLQPERSLARTPIFQTVFTYQNVPFPAWQEGSIRVEPIRLDARKAEFDLLFELFEDGDAIWGRLEYSEDIFDESTVSRIARMFNRLAREFVADPDRPIAELPGAGADELARIRRWSRGPDRDRSDRALLPECFEEQVRRDPDAVAVRLDGQAVTYRELNQRANRLAHRLRRTGAGRGSGTPVGVCLEPSVDLVACLLAVAKAGAAAVVLDPALPAVRLAEATAASGVRLLLTGTPAAGDTAAVDTLAVDTLAAVDTWCLPELAGELAAEPDGDPAPVLDGQDPAWLSHPAGPASPAGVVIDHATLRDRLCWLTETFELAPADRVLAGEPLSGPTALLHLLWPLTCGAVLVLGRAEGRLDARYLVDLTRSERVTVAHLLPSALDGMLRERGVGGRCASLRRVICRGAPVPAGLRERFFDRLGGELVQLYGPAQGLDVAGWVCREDESGRSPIGVPAANTRVCLLDRFGQPVPAGMVGEVFVGGAGAARVAGDHAAGVAGGGPVPDPFGGPGDRLLPTGDLGRFRPDGVIEYAGRRDRQPRDRGVRIDLDVIESVLLEHDRVDSAVVVARGFDPVRLVAYLTGDGSRVADVTGYLRQRLPEFMVPSACVVLPALPLTPEGTVDTAALPEFDLSRPQPQVPFTAPGTELERSIAQAWRELLGIDRIGVHDNFFDLGGHSLLATRLTGQLAAAYRVTMPIRVLFDNPTVAGLAAWITEQGGPDGSGADAIPVVDRGAGVPLSFSQEEICAHHPAPLTSRHHNVLTAVRLAGPLDEAALRAGLDAILRRHEALRTRIVPDGSSWRQLVDPPVAWPLATVDLRGYHEPTRSKELRRLVEEEESRPFRLDAELPVRASLVRLDPEQAALILVMHHIVTDNWSYGVLVNELCEHYRAALLGRAPQLPPLPIQYPDFAAWQRGRLASGALDDDVRYWRDQLAGLPPPPTLTAADQPGLAPATGFTRGFALDGGATAGLAEIARDGQASLFMVLMAAYQVLLAGYSGSDDVVVTFPVAGRERPETAGLIGYFVNNLVVRVDLSANPTFRQLVTQVREKTLAGYAHQEVPLWSLDGVGDAHLRIRFNLLNASVPGLDLPGLRAEPLDLRIGSEYVFDEVVANMEPPDLDLALIMREHDGQLRGMWLYSLQRLDPAALAVLMDRWPRLVDLVVAHPDRGVRDLAAMLREPAVAGAGAPARKRG